MTAIVMGPAFGQQLPGQGRQTPNLPLGRVCRRTVLADQSLRCRVSDDAVQWTLQYQHGLAIGKPTGRRGQRYCITRQALLRGMCGDVEPKALAIVAALPERHP